MPNTMNKYFSVLPDDYKLVTKHDADIVVGQTGNLGGHVSYTTDNKERLVGAVMVGDKAVSTIGEVRKLMRAHKPEEQSTGSKLDDVGNLLSGLFSKLAGATALARVYERAVVRLLMEKGLITTAEWAHAYNAELEASFWPLYDSVAMEQTAEKSAIYAKVYRRWIEEQESFFRKPMNVEFPPAPRERKQLFDE